MENNNLKFNWSQNQEEAKQGYNKAIQQLAERDLVVPNSAKNLGQGLTSSAGINYAKAELNRSGVGGVMEAEKLARNQIGNNRDKGDFEFDTNAGITGALGAIPGQMAMFSTKPTTQGEANSRILGSAANLAQAGMAAGGPLGAAIGGGVGAITGLIANGNWKKEQREAEDEAVRKKEEEERKQRLEYYMAQKSSEDIKKEAAVYAQSLGYNS